MSGYPLIHYITDVELEQIGSISSSKMLEMRTMLTCWLLCLPVITSFYVVAYYLEQWLHYSSIGRHLELRFEIIKTG